MVKKENESQNKRELLRKQYEEKAGVPLVPSLQQFLDADPDFFEAYIAYRSVPWERGVLPPKVKEFIYLAIDASVTHMYELGVKLHLKRALDMGATKEELIEVLELVSVLGVHTMMLSIPLLEEELKRR